jgi:hypothetical protein
MARNGRRAVQSRYRPQRSAAQPNCQTHHGLAADKSEVLIRRQRANKITRQRACATHTVRQDRWHTTQGIPL